MFELLVENPLSVETRWRRRKEGGAETTEHGRLARVSNQIFGNANTDADKNERNVGICSRRYGEEARLGNLFKLSGSQRRWIYSKSLTFRRV